MKKNSGYTLIELVTVILIMGVLVAGASVSLKGMENADVDGAANKLVSILTQARSQSVTKAGGTIWFEIKCDGTGNLSAHIYQGDMTNPSAATELDKISLCNKKISLVTKKETPSGSIQQQLNPGNSVKFQFLKPSGELTEKYTDITLKGSKDVNIIVIYETGRCIIEE